MDYVLIVVVLSWFDSWRVYVDFLLKCSSLKQEVIHPANNHGKSQ